MATEEEEVEVEVMVMLTPPLQTLFWSLKHSELHGRHPRIGHSGFWTA